VQFSGIKAKAQANAHKAGDDRQAEIAKRLSGIERYIIKSMDGISKAWDSWSMSTVLTGLSVEGSMSVGNPGCLHGPKMQLLLNASNNPGLPNTSPITGAINDGGGEAWKKWQSNVTVPALHIFPSHEGYPGPASGLTPNIPFLMKRLVSANLHEMSTPKLTEAILGKKPGSDPFTMGVVSAITNSFGTVFQLWLATQLVTKVMIQGPVPTFRPPFITAGPVAVGSAFQLPGGLSG